MSERDRARLSLPASKRLVDDLEAVAVDLGVERTQLGVVALELGLRVIRGWQPVPAGLGWHPTGAPGLHAGTAPEPEGIPRAPVGIRHGVASRARARQQQHAPDASVQAAAAAPEQRGEEAVPAALDPDDQALLEEAVEFRAQELEAEGGVRSPAGLRRKLRADFLQDLDEAERVLDRKERAARSGEDGRPRVLPRAPGRDPT